MTLVDFAKQIQLKVSESLGCMYQVRLQEVQKNNNVCLQGLIILETTQNISPTIYLDDFYEAYLCGYTMEHIVEKILDIYKDDMPKKSVDMGFFRDFSQVRNRICYRLVAADKNKELLDRIPHKRYMDLAICFYYAYEGDVLGSGTILIYNTHVDMWNTSTEELLVLAGENTPQIFPCRCESMNSVLEEFTEGNCDRTNETVSGKEERERFMREMPMQILSNQKGVYGAAVILYPGLLRETARKLQDDFYIIPSSIHEVILLPDTAVKSVSELKSMIKEVNATQVEKQEILSFSLYFYSREKDSVILL